MEPDAADLSVQSDWIVKKEAPQLVSVLEEMMGGLDVSRSKIEYLIAKVNYWVRVNQYPTADGISYLEAKHLLLLSYCQSLVYYLLRKAKGIFIEGHEVRRIDKKMQYQIQKLMGTTDDEKDVATIEKEPRESVGSEDRLKYHPNPDMLVSKTEDAILDSSGVYRPSRFAPAVMDEDKKSRGERNKKRRREQMIRQSEKSTVLRDLRNEMEGRPEEISEYSEIESKEYSRYLEKRRYIEQMEEELFARAPITKMDKKREKHLKKSRNGPFDDFKSFDVGGEDGNLNDRPYSDGGRKKFKKGKTKR